MAVAVAANPPVAVDSAALPSGYRVFEYRIEKMLGGGGFGLTYLAHDVNLELPVALKEYFPGDLASRAADHTVHVRAEEGTAQFTWGLERFLDEARALASFRHPNIARILRYFKENGTAYIVMEYETGDPLKRWLARQTTVNQKSLLALMYPLMDGLEAVHKMNFLHRDIKPDNIYIRADGSPVLLDFGAARRVTANRDMTNIVSPGFAPFEQYHSQGNQGPWTDIYSLGAVMYWMVTGQKPLESASRVKQDTMRSALEVGNPSCGAATLKAIDWAMQPDESRRPQSVAEFRAALVGSEDARTQLLPPTQRTTDGSPVNSDVLAFAASSQSFPQSQSEPLRKNVLGTIMFLDLVAFSNLAMDQQVAVKARFNELITKALKGILESSRIVIDTGDGAAVCFLGDPEEALQSALLLRGLLMQKYGQAMLVRIGLHMGPMRMVFDINNRVNVVGDGINVAQRIMDFAQANQIVVSRAYYDVVSRITDLSAGMFSHLGPHLDKHLRSHDIYAVLDPHAASASPARPSIQGFENTATFPVMVSLTPEMAGDIETELARLIGPLARILVKKALPRAISPQGLRDLLAVSIPDPNARETFSKGKSVNSTSNVSSPNGANRTQNPAHNLVTASNSAPDATYGNHSRPNTSSQQADASGIVRFAMRSDSGQSLRQDVTQPAKEHGNSSQPALLSADHTQPYPVGFQASRPVISQPNSAVLSYLTAGQLGQLEKILSHYIGPMARVIIKKEAQRHTGLPGLLAALGLHVDSAEDRAKFMAELKKLQYAPRG